MVHPQPLYSLGLAPRDFWLCPKVKMTMREQCFKSVQSIKAAITKQLKIFQKKYFQNCFSKHHGQWDESVQREGECFRGIHVPFSVINCLKCKHHCIFFNHILGLHTSDSLCSVCIHLDLVAELWRKPVSISSWPLLWLQLSGYDQIRLGHLMKKGHSGK